MRIPLPAHFHEIENSKIILQVLKFFALWLAPGFLSLYIWSFGLPLWVSIPVIGLLAIIGAHGLQCIALLGHEGTHFALHKNRWESAKLGIILSSFTPSHFDAGFAVTHAEHHAFANTEKDPDHVFFSRYQNFWSRLLLARFASSQRYLKTTLLLAFNRWPEGKTIRVGLALPDMKRLALINLAVSLSISAAYLLLTYLFPIAMILILWTPFVLAILVSGLRPYVEHVGTGPGRGVDSRSWISPIFDLLYGSINYHQAHHLYPKVPSYKLKKAHHWMKENKAGIDESSIEIGSLAEFLRVASKPL